MQFELSICHNGRQYKAVRSLARIRLLRADLAKQAQIPELPPLDDDCKTLGFILLQELIKSYSPTLEEWFFRILDQFPFLAESSSLTDFLYEPLDLPKNLYCDVRLRLNSSLPAKLYAIEESDTEDEEPDEDSSLFSTSSSV